MHTETKIIYLIGKPGTGKYTIAKELSESGYIICDNQLVNNPIFTLLNYDGFSKIPEFAWNAIGKIRNYVFDFIIHETSNNYVLTNCLFEDDGDLRLFNQVEGMAAMRSSIFVPVKLLISQKEHLKRITNPARRERRKSIDPEDIYSAVPLLTISHPNLLELNVSKLPANDAANAILSHVSKIK